jgi:hypothetical protein
MEHKIKLEKGRNGWKATTNVELEGGARVLMLVTSKHTVQGRAAGVSTNATVHKVNGRFLSFELFGDYCKTVMVNNIARSTEANVHAVHAEALKKLDAILAEVTEFYKAKAAKEAPKEKTFNAYWSDDFDNPGTRTVSESFFTEANCYSAADIQAIAALDVGQTWRAPDYGDAHTVTRES